MTSGLHKLDPINRLLLMIPEPWLDRWAMPVNAFTGALCLGWAAACAVVTAGGLWGHFHLTAAQGVALSIGWLPVMMANMLFGVAQTAHMLTHLYAQREQLLAIDAQLADIMRGSEEGWETTPKDAGPTLQ